MKKHFIFLFILGLLVACEMNPIEQIDNQNLPIISGYISPNDSLVKITVRRMMPLNKPVNIFETMITDAEVQIRQQNKITTLQYNGKTEYYEAIIKFKPAEKVNLFVKLVSGKEATAQTIIPVEVKNIQYKYLNDRLFELSWDSSINSYFSVVIRGTSTDTPYEKLEYSRKFPENYYFKIKKGEDRSNQIGKYYHYRSSFFEKMYLNTIVDWGVVSLDSAMYFFHKADKEAFYVSPFQDRTPIFNNIKGGVGIFGSYIITEKTVKLIEQ